MMYANPFRMMVIPPGAVVPHMVVVIVAVCDTPVGVNSDPFRMMDIDPARVMFMPPRRVMPHMMLVPISVMTVRMRNNRRRCEQCCQRGGRE